MRKRPRSADRSQSQLASWRMSDLFSMVFRALRAFKTSTVSESQRELQRLSMLSFENHPKHGGTNTIFDRPKAELFRTALVFVSVQGYTQTQTELHKYPFRSHNSPAGTVNGFVFSKILQKLEKAGTSNDVGNSFLKSGSEGTGDRANGHAGDFSLHK